MISARVLRSVDEVLRMVEAEKRTEQACAEALVHSECHPSYVERRRQAAARLDRAVTALRQAYAALLG
jgi:hypothetical protein